MIQQDRFLFLLAAIEALEAQQDGYVRIFKQAQGIVEETGNYKAAFAVVSGYHNHHEYPLTKETMRAIESERAHFKTNAKRNAQARAYQQRKKALDAHNEYKAKVGMPAPWVGKVDPPKVMPVAKEWTHEEMAAMNEAARAMPQYDQEPEHLRVVREKLEALKILGVTEMPKGMQDEEILGDVEEDFNPFGEGK